jgi:hypothetical protein
MSYDKKYIQESSNVFSKAENKSKQIDNFLQGIVVSITDEFDGMRIKVRIPNIDNKIDDNDLPYAFPMAAKFFYSLPKIGEAVNIFIPNPNKPYNNRYWMGSIISQYQNINIDPYYYTALSLTDYKVVNPKEGIKKIPSAKGIYPTDSDTIGLIGRNNSDLMLKPRETTLRAGQHIVNDNLVLNTKNPAYLKLKLSDDGTTSYSILYGDNVYLLSHKGVNRIKSIIESENDYTTLNEKTHPLTKGDKLVELINLIRNALLTHVHGYSGKNADDSNFITKLKDFDISTILSNNIRIN